MLRPGAETGIILFEEGTMKINVLRENAGRVAYASYSANSGGKSLISGEPLPAFDAQKSEIKAAWEAAATSVLENAIGIVTPHLSGTTAAHHKPADTHEPVIVIVD
jgi:hypothetical protein